MRELSEVFRIIRGMRQWLFYKNVPEVFRALGMCNNGFITKKVIAVYNIVVFQYVRIIKSNYGVRQWLSYSY